MTTRPSTAMAAMVRALSALALALPSASASTMHGTGVAAGPIHRAGPAILATGRAIPAAETSISVMTSTSATETRAPGGRTLVAIGLDREQTRPGQARDQAGCGRRQCRHRQSSRERRGRPSASGRETVGGNTSSGCGCGPTAGRQAAPRQQIRRQPAEARAAFGRQPRPRHRIR